jgi:hypothetical protein
VRWFADPCTIYQLLDGAFSSGFTGVLTEAPTYHAGIPCPL